MSGKSIDLQKLTQRKVTMPLILIVGLVVLGWRSESLTIGFLDDYFILRVEAAEQYDAITAQVASNAGLIKGHINEYKLNENAKALARVDDHIYDLKQFVSVSGVSQLTRNRERELDREKKRLNRVRACILRDDPVENCSAIL